MDENDPLYEPLWRAHRENLRSRRNRFLCELLACFAVVALCLLAIAYLA